MLRFHARHRVRQITEQVLHLILCERVILGIPFFGVSQPLAIHLVAFGLIAELVVEELVKEHLRYNLVFTARTSQAESPGSALQRINEGNSSLRYIDVAHYLICVVALL